MFRKKVSLKASNYTKTDIIDHNASFTFIEGYRSLRTNLAFTTYSEDIKTILVTSSLPGEGKSSISINLARTLSMSGKKVLLIDGDLRSPSIHKYLRIRNKVKEGFSTVLSGRTKLEDEVHKFPPLEIDVMLSGPIPPNASELLSRSLTGEMLLKLGKNYDVIIIDTPPSGIVTDSVVLSNYTDGILFVVKQNYAEQEVIRDSFKAFEASGAKILGAVLNDYTTTRNAKSLRSYDSQYIYCGEQKQ